jgi:transcriptional regulator with XRE-family HTH domain
MRVSNRTPSLARGSRLAEAMLLRGWNKQTALAEALGVRPSAVSRWLKSGSLSFEHAVAVCDFLNISLDWLMLGRGRPDLEDRIASQNSSAVRIRARDALKTFTATLPELFAGEGCYEADALATEGRPGEANGAEVGIIEVALRNGRVLRLPDRFPPARVARLVEALEE